MKKPRGQAWRDLGHLLADHSEIDKSLRHCGNQQLRTRHQTQRACARPCSFAFASSAAFAAAALPPSAAAASSFARSALYCRSRSSLEASDASASRAANRSLPSSELSLTTCGGTVQSFDAQYMWRPTQFKQNVIPAQS